MGKTNDFIFQGRVRYALRDKISFFRYFMVLFGVLISKIICNCHSQQEERIEKPRPITVSDLEARPGSPSIVVVPGSGASSEDNTPAVRGINSSCGGTEHTVDTLFYRITYLQTHLCVQATPIFNTTIFPGKTWQNKEGWQ